MNQVQIYPVRRPEALSVELIVKGSENAFVTNYTFTKVIPGHTVPPGMMLSETETQALMDRLWSCGFRPSEGTGSAGALAAVQMHLADMRRIAFSMLEINKP